MKLPWTTRARKPVPELESPPGEIVPRSEQHLSPGLEAVFAGLSHGDAIRVLDLGPAVPENVGFLTGLASRIQVVDTLREAPDVGPAMALLRGLGAEHQASFHLVLLWDCLNYVSPAEGVGLVESIVPLCRPDARCLAMVATSDTMPAAPTRYRIVDERRLTYEQSTTEKSGAPQMTPAAVEDLLAGFSIEHSFVLRNGIREYVAIRDAAGEKLPG